MLSNREEIIEEINQKFKQELEVVLANEEWKKLLWELRAFSEQSFDFWDWTNFKVINDVERLMKSIFFGSGIDLLQWLWKIFYFSLWDQEKSLLGEEQFISHDNIDSIWELLWPSNLINPTSYSKDLEWEERYNNNEVINSNFNYQNISNIQKVFSLLFEKIWFVIQ
jgi:hypothetical protein